MNKTARIVREKSNTKTSSVTVYGVPVATRKQKELSVCGLCDGNKELKYDSLVEVRFLLALLIIQVNLSCDGTANHQRWSRERNVGSQGQGLKKIRGQEQARSQKSATGVVLEVWVGSPQRSKILRFFAKITSF